MWGTIRNFALWAIIVLLLLALFTLFQSPGSDPRLITGKDVPLSEFLEAMEYDQVRRVTIEAKAISGMFIGERGNFRTYAPNGLRITVRRPGDEGFPKPKPF